MSLGTWKRILGVSIHKYIAFGLWSKALWAEPARRTAWANWFAPTRRVLDVVTSSFLSSPYGCYDSLEFAGYRASCIAFCLRKWALRVSRCGFTITRLLRFARNRGVSCIAYDSPGTAFCLKQTMLCRSRFNISDSPSTAGHQAQGEE